MAERGGKVKKLFLQQCVSGGGGEVKKGIYLYVLRLQNDGAKANHTGAHGFLNHPKKVCPQWLFLSGKHLQAL